MKFSTAILSASIVASSALAAPAPQGAPAWTKPEVDGKFITYWKKKFGQLWKVEKPSCDAPEVPEEKCMTDDEADDVAAYFRDLIRGYTIEQALAGLTEDFVDYSSAVSIVINKGAAEPNNILEPIFTSREQFMNGHGKQQPIPFETTNVWHNCNGTVSMRWYTTRSGQGQATEAAAIALPGMVVLETIPAEEGNVYPYRIHTIYSEFNSAAWLVNLGVFKPDGPVTPVSEAEAGTPDKRNVDVLGLPRDTSGYVAML